MSGAGTIEIKPGTLINTGLHEDDDFFVVKKPVKAQVVGQPRDSALPVVIPEIGERVLYYHQPEPAKPAGKG